MLAPKKHKVVTPSNQSFSFYKKPTGPGGGGSGGSPSAAESGLSSTPPSITPPKPLSTSTSVKKPKVVLNPTVVNPPTSIPTTTAAPPTSSSNSGLSSRQSSGSSLLSSLSAPRVSFASSFSRNSASPPSRPTSTPSNQNNTAPPVPPHATSLASSTQKPTCAVNGVPKVTSSPSYVAKINYFSNLSQAAANTPMKPINSIPAPSKENPAKEIIYAPSNVDMSGEDKGGERSHYAATIRRSRPQYYNNKDLEGDLNDANSNPVSEHNAANKNKQGGTLGRKPMGIYGSLGRKVATPVIRSNSIEKEKREARSRDSTPDTASSNGSADALITKDPVPAAPSSTGSRGSVISSNSGTSPQIGYKPFNPYLNRQLTFSTFRPSSGSTDKTNSSSNSSISSSTTTGSSAGTATGPANGKCAAVASAKPGTANGVGVPSPVQLRSPNRLVK